MNTAINTLLTLRKSLNDLTKDLNIEQLNKIPPGFNNNIIWNIGHVIATQQGLCYSRSGLPTIISESFFSMYKSGSKPERFIEDKEVIQMRGLLTSSIEQLEKDYQENVFEKYSSLTTRYGVVLSNIDEAINFLPFHEGFHMGYVLSLKRLVVQ